LSRRGAPLGNRRARKHGAYTARMKALRAEVHAVVSAARETIRMRKELLAAIEKVS